MPYFISREIQSPIDVFFETISGFTATGSTAIRNLEGISKSILLWRSITQWIGGFATIIMFMTLVSKLNIGGYRLFSLKGKRSSDFKFIVSRVFLIYFTFTILQYLTLDLAGMKTLESIYYSLGTISTGCFSPGVQPLTDYSPHIQYIIAFFMLLSGLSFINFFFLLRGKFKTILHDEEFKVFVLIILLLTLCITGVNNHLNGKGLEVNFREAIFQVSSIVVSSGYSITDYGLWPDFLLFILFFFLLVGGSTNSSSGGLKIPRFLILFKNSKLQFNNPNSPSNAYRVTYNKTIVDENNNLSVLTYIVVFGVMFVMGTIALSFYGNDFKAAAFLSVSSLVNFGSSQNLANIPGGEKIILNLLMLFGRLEIFPLLFFVLPVLKKDPI